MIYIKYVFAITAFFVVIIGGYMLLDSKIPSLFHTKKPIETTTWEQLIAPGAYDILTDYDYTDTLSDEELDAVWIQAETATNPLMDGKRVLINGFMVSIHLDTSKQVHEFILVPYEGACIHTPPPPPNQTIFVKAPNGTKVWDNWEPVEIIGVLRIEQREHDIASTGFTLLMESIKAYDDNIYNPKGNNATVYDDAFFPLTQSIDNQDKTFSQAF